jgi:hypothetical protein
VTRIVLASVLIALVAKAAPVPKDDTPAGVIALVKAGPKPELLVLSPRGTILTRLDLSKLEGHPGQFRLAPDGKRVAITTVLEREEKPGERAMDPNHLYLFDLTRADQKPKRLLERRYCLHVTWAPDGKSLYCSDIAREKLAVRRPGVPNFFRHEVYSLAAGSTEPLKLSEDHIISDVSADGRLLLTREVSKVETDPQRAFVVPLTTLKPELLTDQSLKPLRFSPDGQDVLGRRLLDGKDVQGAVHLLAIKRSGKQETRFPLPDKAVGVVACDWSPDAKRIVCLWYEELDGGRVLADRLSVSTLDGTKSAVIFKGEPGVDYFGVEWR